ncbi:MAG: glycosyl hydrolase [Chlorobi bacterium]|nr:glycosyl hydrolase [Chlorobiota bacterium]
MRNESKIDSLIKLMTLEEKTKLLHASSSFTSGGVERLGIPELVMSDGPHGVRMEHGRDWEFDNITTDSATYLPTGITLASTWNEKLGYKYGTVLGSEANERKKDIILGPGVNIIRSPLNGRNFEYMTEDPFLAGKMASGYIKGVQSQGIGACVKHYTANNQETKRGSINAVISERALQEIYLPAFRRAIKEGNVYSIMPAYNKVNGQYCSENKYLMEDVLRKEFNFKGIAISDWGAVHSTKETLLHGVDIEMGTELANKTRKNPNYDEFFLGNPVVKLVKEHPDYEKFVDEKVRRILRVMFAVHKFDNNRPEGERNTKEHHELARKVAEEGIVLLKNENNILPLNDDIKTIAVIGDNATARHAINGGSSQVKAQYEITPLEAIKKELGDKYKIIYARGYEPNKENAVIPELEKEALNAAAKADVVIYVGGWLHNLPGNQWGKYRYDAEGKDKTSYEFPFKQKELMNKLSEIKPMIAVIFGGSFARHDKWVDNTKAILFAGYPGMEGGTAIAEILSGKVNPSGKLTFTIANKLNDYPSHKLGEFPGNGKDVLYREGIFVGYRYFDTSGKDVMFPFGHGLSYTTFDITNIKPENKEFSKNDTVRFTVDVTNTGERDGAEVVQVYIYDKFSAVKRPVKELKAFKKVFLKKGETKTLSFELSNDAFSYWNPLKKSWVTEPGDFDILVGSSSTDINQTATVTYK